MRLINKIALVTGGGSGLGEAISKRFAEEGAFVFVSDIDFEEAQRVSEEIGDSALALMQDVADESAWVETIANIVSTKGQLDVLVNNAGICIHGTVESASLDDWRKTQSVNLESVFLGTREAIKVMKVLGGSIINISSIMGLVGDPNVAAYNASKGGIHLFTKSAALHCAEKGYGIRVNSIHPGFMNTSIVDKANAEISSEEAAGIVEKMLENIPLGKMGSPLDIANGSLFLASEESRYMTGAELVIDGGFTAK